MVNHLPRPFAALQAQLAKEAWGAALQRAKGDKVLDDPRLLKKSLKKVGGGRGQQRRAWQLLRVSAALAAAHPGVHAA